MVIQKHIENMLENIKKHKEYVWTFKEEIQGICMDV